LAALAFEEGLISQNRYREIDSESRILDDALAMLLGRWLAPNDRCDAALVQAGLGPVARPMTALDLLRRPEANAHQIARALALLGETRLALLPERMLASLELEAKYGAFIKRARREADRLSRLEDRMLPPDLDYESIVGLRIEARHKLGRSRPLTVAQAGRMAGVTPADVAALLIHAARDERSAPVEAMPR
jgi:tRNA uridine 5-carboxymethylaminomethyl modification enzyme